MSAMQNLIKKIQEKKTPLIVGIDPIYQQIPPCYGTKAPQRAIKEHVAAIELFCTTIIDVAAHLVPAVKIQIAFFEAFGSLGIGCFERVCQYAKDRELFVIVDCKRGDIASSAAGYCQYYFPPAQQNPAEQINIDAITLNPFMGLDTIEPFVNAAKQKEGALFILTKTSNPGSSLLQNCNVDGERLFEKLATEINTLAELNRCPATGYSLVGNVVGATYPEEARAIRKRCPHSFFLVPGLGSQAGSFSDIKIFLNPDGMGALFNMSRGIIFAFRDFGYQPEYVTIEQHRHCLEKTITQQITKINQNL